MTQVRQTSGRKGFARAGTLVQSRVRKASEGRGFAETRLLTHWAEIVGKDIAATTRPVTVTFAKGGGGGTLTLLTTGALAPMIEMQKEMIREKVNACYGYAAIARVRITQTAASGFADGRVAFDHAPKKDDRAPSAETTRAAQDVAAGVASDDLRLALERLGTNVLNKTRNT